MTIKWEAWAKVNGPIGGLRADYLAAEAALRTAWSVDDGDRHIGNFLPPWRRLADYRPWVDFGDLADPEPLEYSVD